MRSILKQTLHNISVFEIVTRFILLFVVLGFFQAAYCDDISLDLNEQQLDWLAVHDTINVGVSSSLPPMSFSDKDGINRGINVDIIEIINSKLGGRLKIVSGPWPKIYQQASEGKLDALLVMNQSKVDANKFSFTQSYIDIPHVILGREQDVIYDSVESLSGKKVAVESNYYDKGSLSSTYSEVNFVDYETTGDALKAVFENQVDAYVGNLATVEYFIFNNPVFDHLKIHSKASFLSTENVIAVNESNAILKSILDRAIDSFGEDQRLQILSAWGVVDNIENIKSNCRSWFPASNKLTVYVDRMFSHGSKKDSDNQANCVFGILSSFTTQINYELDLVPLGADDLFDKARSLSENEIAILANNLEDPVYKDIYAVPGFLSYLSFYALNWQSVNYDSLESLRNKVIAIDDIRYLPKRVYDKLLSIDSSIVETHSIEKAINLAEEGKVDGYLGIDSFTDCILLENSDLMIRKSFVSSQSVTLKIVLPSSSIPYASDITSSISGIISMQRRSRLKQWSTNGILRSCPALNQDQLEWVKNNPVIRVPAGFFRPPFTMGSELNPEGLSFDYLELLTRQAGIKVEYVKEPLWLGQQNMLANDSVDLLSFIRPTNERSKYALFTEPYVEVSLGLFVNKNEYDISDGIDVAGKKVAVLRDTKLEYDLSRKWTNVEIVSVAGIEEAVIMLSVGDVDAGIFDYASAMWVIERNRVKNVAAINRIASQEADSYKITMGVRDELDVLKNIIDLSYKSLTKREKEIIESNWIVSESAEVLPYWSSINDISRTSVPVYTESQERWIKKKKVIRVGSKNDWPPFDFLENNEAVGFGNDYIRLIADKAGLEVEFVYGYKWSTLLEMMRNQEIDALSAVWDTHERREYMNYLNPYHYSKHAVITPKDSSIKYLDEMAGKTLGLIEGFGVNQYIEREYPDINFVYFPSPVDLLIAVENNNIDAAIEQVEFFNYMKSVNAVNNTKISSIYNNEGRGLQTLHIGLRNDDPMLFEVLQTASNSVSSNDFVKLKKKWLTRMNVADCRSLLTMEEQKWLDDHSVIDVGYDYAFPPLEFYENGRPVGIAVDILSILGDCLGVEFRFCEPQSWKSVTEKLKSGELDMYSCAAMTPERMEYADFTSPYISIPCGIATRTDASLYVGGINELKDKRVAVVVGYALTEKLEADWPDLNYLYVDNFEEGLKAVKDGRAFAFVGNMLVAGYLIRENYYTEIHFTGETPYSLELCMAAGKHVPMLRSILQKSLDSISDEKKQNIIDNWSAVNIQQGVSPTTLIEVAVGFLIVIVVFVLWNLRLAKEIKARKTAEQNNIESERRFRVIFERSKDAIVIIDLAGRILNCNKAALGLLGFESKYDSQNYNIVDLFILKKGKTRDQLRPKVVNSLMRIFQEGGGHFEALRQRVDGSHFMADMVLSPLRLREGRYLLISVRDRTEEYRIKEVMTRTQFAVDNAIDEIYFLDEEGKFVYANATALKNFGFGSDEIKGKTIYDINPKFNKPLWTNNWKECKQKGVLKFESVHIRGDGSEYPVEVWQHHIEINTNEFICSFVRDITQRNLMESQLRNSEQRTRVLFDTVQTGIVLIDAENRKIVDVNDSAIKMYGGVRSEVIGKTCDQVLCPADIDNCPILDKGQKLDNSERFLLCKDGSQIPILKTCSIVRLNGKDYVLESFVDITKQKEMEREIEEARQWLQTIIDTSDVLIFAKDKSGRYLLANKKFEEVVGVKKEDIIGKDDTDLFKPEMARRIMNADREIIKSKGMKIAEETMLSADGTVLDFISTKVPLYDDNGKFYALAGQSTDITSLKNMQKQLREAKEAAEAANKAKSVFLANMSHEIRTPMNAILGYTQLLLKDSELSGDNREYAEVISRSGEHLLGLINDILDMSKIEAGRVALNKEVVDFYGIIEDIESMFRVRTNDKGLDFVVNFKGKVPRFIEADSGKLRQVMINILGNAVKFTEYGSIIVTIGDCKRVNKDKDVRLYVQIADSGPGIANEEMNKVFEVFGQTGSAHGKVIGTGLGMAISREYAKIMGGNINVTSKVGKGSVFRFEFDANIVEGQEYGLIEPEPDNKIIGLAEGQSVPLVMIVDDSDTNRDVLRIMLEKIGIETCEAYDGYCAVDMVKETKPDLILMDMRMPGMDGIETSKKIREEEGNKGIPIIMVTASALEEQRAESMRAGLDGFIRKPFKESEILKEIKTKLKLEFEYEVYESKSDKDESANVSAEDLKELSDETIDAIKDMAECGNIAALNELIETKVRIKSEKLANTLKVMVENYRYDGIFELLSQKKN